MLRYQQLNRYAVVSDIAIFYLHNLAQKNIISYPELHKRSIKTIP